MTVLNKRGDLQSGKRAEDAALAYLMRQGLALIARNHRCRRGEIDLIMRDKDVTVFVEVRFRQSQRYGGALESVNWVKQNRIVAAASHYLASAAPHGPVRFDVVAMAPHAGEFAVNWVQDAFRVS